MCCSLIITQKVQTHCTKIMVSIVMGVALHQCFSAMQPTATEGLRYVGTWHSLKCSNIIHVAFVAKIPYTIYKYNEFIYLLLITVYS